ncbi:MAG TPA: protein kinase, partial [Phototrophicaceae bacterium]|nr:protein kinase [Phototrophicaceae bacterium]
MGDLIGQTIRDYKILERIGAGGHGEVYKAQQISIERIVAIKVILPEYVLQPEFIKRFEAEARIVARLEHPHIVPLYDYWHDAQGIFLVMRYVPSGSLRDLLKNQGYLSLETIVRVINQISDALAIAHHVGIIHRDLKPDNMLLDEYHNTYLTDFGIAKSLYPFSTGTETPVVTEADMMVGTPGYLSPEQIQNGLLSAQTDIYALGVLLFELVTGKHPFSDSAPIEMIIRHVRDPLPAIQTIKPDLPDSINKVIARATAKNPADRYADIQSMAADFAAAIHATPIAQTWLSVPSPSPSVPSPSKTVSLVPDVRAERNRKNMLRNVRTFWIEGVLENSLDGTGLRPHLIIREREVHNPWKIQPGSQISEVPIILEFFDRLNGKLLILGAPGSGKTTLMLELARDLLDRAESDPVHPLPILFNLSSWTEKQPPLTEWLMVELVEKYQVPKKMARLWVEDDELLLLLDGLDEVAAEARKACIAAINQYREEHGFVDIVVCSRVADYDQTDLKIHLNGAIELLPLDDQQIDSWLATRSNEGAGSKIVKLLLDEDSLLRELCRSPLMLRIVREAYSDNRSTTAEIEQLTTSEEQRQRLFVMYVDRMISQRQTIDYTPEQTTHYLSWLANQMHRRSESVFHIEQLQPAWLNPEQQKHYIRNLEFMIIGIHGLA